MSQFAAAASAAMGPGGIGEKPNATPYLIASVAELLCCCLPLGIAGLVLSILAMNAANAGNYVEAQKHLKNAKIALIVGAIGGALIGVGWLR